MHSQPAVKDADNRLLWRMNRVRLTAEQVRDSVLQFAGRLDHTIGGPPAVQFAHRGKNTFMPDGELLHLSIMTLSIRTLRRIAAARYIASCFARWRIRSWMRSIVRTAPP